MTEQNLSVSYEQLSNELNQQRLGITASELHGFLSGIICGGNHDQSWQPLLQDFVNDGKAFSSLLYGYLARLQQKLLADLQNDEFNFQLLLPADDVFNRADELSGWVNHFLLGLGLTQPRLDKLTGDIAEIIEDLRSIALLGYDEDDDQEELERSLEEVAEYVRMAAIFCFNEFSGGSSLTKEPVIH